MSKKQIALAVLVQGTGAHPAAWMNTGADHDRAVDVGFYVEMAQLAERGMFDLFFVADTPATRTGNLHAWRRYPMYTNVLEPLTLLSAVAGATSRIGLGGTASTSFTEPYNVARMFASLDHISRGRAAWNVVTSANDYAARNFGLEKLPPHDERYARAHEYLNVVKKLWDTWEDDAFVNNTEEMLYFDAEKFHPVAHDGKYFRVNGGLNIARPPQGRPVIIQAGASSTGKEFAAETAEVVFGSDPTLDQARTFHDDLKGRMGKFGRSPDELKLLTGLSVVVGDTAAQAEAEYQRLQSMIHPDVGIMRLNTDIETDLSDLPLDEPVPLDRIPKSSNFHQTYFENIADMIRKGYTLREIYMRYERGNHTMRGTAGEIADHMEEWVDAGACDGYMLVFHTIPGGLRDFVEKVVPELQRRGRLRTAYAGTMLREHLGLARPAHERAA